MSNSYITFTEDDLVRRLKEASIIDMGSVLSSSKQEDLIRVATGLGFGRSEEIERIRLQSNPGYELLRTWRSRDRSTIRVLRNVLKNTERYDIIDILDKAKQDPTDLTIVLKDERGQESDLSLKGVPGLKPLMECVRPYVYNPCGPRSREKICICLLAPKCSGKNWNTPASAFEGQEVSLEMILTKTLNLQVQKRHTEVPQASCSQQSFPAQRWVSCIDEEKIFFMNSEEMTKLPVQEVGPGTLLSIPKPAQSPREQNGETVPSGSDFAIDPVMPFYNEDITSLPGFHGEIPTDEHRREKAKEALRGHLKTNGAYIIRRPGRTTTDTSVASLSVVYNGDVVHYSILYQPCTNGRRTFFLSKNGHEAETVAGLIEHYKCNPFSLPTNTNIVIGLQLTTPVS